MRWLLSAAAAAAFVGSALAQAESTKVVDSVTGFTFSSYTNDKGITYRVAVPDLVAADKAFDAVVQIIAPIGLGWIGLAWGGSMTYNPLTIVWANGKTPVVSSRMAYGYYVPPAYTATYEVLTKGTYTNATHLSITAVCSGCTQWGDEDTGITTLGATAQQSLAFGYSATPVDTPSNNASSFSIHDMVGHWLHDFSSGVNTAFNATIAKNL